VSLIFPEQDVQAKSKCSMLYDLIIRENADRRYSSKGTLRAELKRERQKNLGENLKGG